MTYLAQSQLESEPSFTSRCRAALTDQSLVFKDSQLPDLQALAAGLLRNEGGPTGTFLRMLAGAPGFADQADSPDGFNSSLISDASILSAVQADFPVVAALYFASQGAPNDEPTPSH